LTLLFAAFVAVAPRVAARRAGAGGAGWCREGLCFVDLERGEVSADRATLTWDGRLKLGRVRGPVPASGGGGTGGLPLRSIEVEELRVLGTPLPPLHGQLAPLRHLEGDGVVVDGDTVRAELETPWGTLAARLEGDGALDATCTCSFTAPGLGGTLDDRSVRLRGRIEDGSFAGTIRVEAAEAAVTAARTDAGFTARATIEDMALADLFGALEPLVPEVRRATIGGSLSGTLEVRWPEGSLYADLLPVSPLVDGLVDARFLGGTFAYPGRDETGATLVVRAGEGTDGWLPLRDMGALLPAAVIAAEDGRFWEHTGYDVAGMQEAAAANRAAGTVVRGGSTLSQQLAKNLFLDGERTYARKLRELLYAVELERELGKKRILELYLNVVEWGPGIRGAKDAAEAYFLKRPAGLLPEEAAWLASILRSPRRDFEREYLRDRPDRQRVAWILENMVDLDAAERAAAMGRPLRFVPP
jgi:hypothetical protein